MASHYTTGQLNMTSDLQVAGAAACRRRTTSLCREPSWLENIRFRIEKAIKRGLPHSLWVTPAKTASCAHARVPDSLGRTSRA